VFYHFSLKLVLFRYVTIVYKQCSTYRKWHQPSFDLVHYVVKLFMNEIIRQS